MSELALQLIAENNRYYVLGDAGVNMHHRDTETTERNLDFSKRSPR